MIKVIIIDKEYELTLQDAITLRNSITTQVNEMQADVAKWLNRLPDEKTEQL